MSDHRQMIDIKKTGECFIPTQSKLNEILVNLERYFFAMSFCEDKIVLDAGHGCGLGTYLFSLISRRTIAIDLNDDALKYAKQYPHIKKKVNFIKLDLNKDVIPDCDVVVALEVIEHLKSPDFFLSRPKKGTKLVFSIPLNSLTVSPGFHKQDFRNLEDISELLERYYDIKEYFTQYERWVYGVGIRLE
uniref:Putative methyltransferase n=1 Tax=viral metagenome TaxID=1070528 RepID=A0A6H2A1G8_9ZZZZ